MIYVFGRVFKPRMVTSHLVQSVQFTILITVVTGGPSISKTSGKSGC